MSLIRDVREGWKILRRGRRALLLLSASTALTGICLSLFLGDVVTEINNMRDGYALRRENAASFSAFYLPGKVADAKAKVSPLLVDQVRQGNSYTMVIMNAGVTDGSADDGTEPPILIFGADTFARIFPSVPSCAPPCAMVGEDAPSKYTGSVIRLATGPVSVRGSIPNGKSMLDPNARGIPLSTRVVAFLPPEELLRLDQVESEEAATRLVVLGANDTQLSPIISAASEAGLNLIPHFLGIEESQRFKDIMFRSSICILAGSSFFAMALLAAFATTRRVLAYEQAGLAVRRMVGATQRNIGISILSSTLGSSLLIPLIFLAPLLAIGGPLRAGAGVVVCANVLVSITLAVFFSLSQSSDRFESRRR